MDHSQSQAAAAAAAARASLLFFFFFFFSGVIQLVIIGPPEYGHEGYYKIRHSFSSSTTSLSSLFLPSPSSLSASSSRADGCVCSFL
jgi:hypothetical protein